MVDKTGLTDECGRVTDSKRSLDAMAEGAMETMRIGEIRRLEKKLDIKQKVLDDEREANSRLKEKNAKLQEAIDNYLAEPEVSRDELIGYAMRRLDEDMQEGMELNSIYSFVASVVDYTEEFYEEKADEDDCCQCDEDRPFDYAGLFSRAE